ncbi:uncharacterized protein [Lolium perenne]|uniref:uncharacterized protein isoform X1 n=2 Tax=Lolium perenne TaxID=4522 RepID=UPI003A995761
MVGANLHASCLPNPNTRLVLEESTGYGGSVAGVMNNDRFPTEGCNQAPGKRSSNSDYLIAYSSMGPFTHQDCSMTQTHHQNNRCPVDDGGSRHQALGDAGVNKSLQVWINLASKDKSEPMYKEL